MDVAGYVRRVRREVDASQRELARIAEVSLSSVRRLESGLMDPRLSQLGQLLSLADWRLAVIDRSRHEVRPMAELGGDLRDGAERRYPAHLDVILDPRPGEWWGSGYGLSAPPETFRRDRTVRDRQRARSQFEVGRDRQRTVGWG